MIDERYEHWGQMAFGIQRLGIGECRESFEVESGQAINCGGTVGRCRVGRV